MLVQRLFNGQDVHGRSVVFLTRAMRNGKRLATSLEAVLEWQVDKTQPLQNRPGPGLTCQCGGALARASQPPLERVPVGPDVRKRRLHLFTETPTGHPITEVF